MGEMWRREEILTQANCERIRQSEENWYGKSREIEENLAKS